MTGATGLVGNAVLHRLVTEDYPLLILVRDPVSQTALKNNPNVSVAEFHLENITDSVAQAITSFSPDFVIHSAWIGTENTNRNQPEFVYANLQSCLRLLEITSKAGCKSWIGFGSQAEYHSNIETKISEDTPTYPDTAYGIGKLAACQTLQTLAHSAGMHFTWLRLYTCYGKEYKSSYIIPYLIHQLRNHEMPLLKTPNAVWDYLHAEDVADAILTLLGNQPIGGIYNLGYGHGISVGDIALLLAECLHFPEIAKLRSQIEAAVDMPVYRIADITKFTHAFNWMPKIDIRSGLMKCL